MPDLVDTDRAGAAGSSPSASNRKPSDPGPRTSTGRHASDAEQPPDVEPSPDAKAGSAPRHATPAVSGPATVGPPPPGGRGITYWYYRLLPVPYRMPMVVTFLTSLLLCVGFLSLPLAGTDLAAQVARGHFFSEHGFVPIDFRWYGGVYPFGYSAFTGPLNALLGSRGVGAVACVVSAVAFAWLLARVGALRPIAGGVLGAVVGVFNLVSGRTTFALGIMFGILALCALVIPRLSLRWRIALAAVLAACSSAGSPVAGVFTGLCGVALLFTGKRKEGLALSLGAGLALLPPTLFFRDGGFQPFSEESMKVSVGTAVAVFLLMPSKYKTVRVGALLAGVGAMLAFYVPNPMGSNVIRLPMLFAAPLIVAFSTLDKRLLAGIIAVMCWWQPPLMAGDLGHAGTREASRLYYVPLTVELQRRGPVGRVEVVPLRDHWEATYVADVVPIARGWERQVDVQRNALFYDGTLTPATYLEWLYANAVEYVAVPRDTDIDFAGREEAALIEANLPYLRKVWETGDWQLYRVTGGPTLVQYPGELVNSGPTGVKFDVPVATSLTVRVRWSQWLTLRGPDGCIERDGDWVRVRLQRAGSYQLSSSLWFPNRTHC